MKHFHAFLSYKKYIISHCLCISLHYLNIYKELIKYI